GADGEILPAFAAFLGLHLQRYTAAQVGNRAAELNVFAGGHVIGRDLQARLLFFFFGDSVDSVGDGDELGVLLGELLTASSCVGVFTGDSSTSVIPETRTSPITPIPITSPIITPMSAMPPAHRLAFCLANSTLPTLTVSPWSDRASEKMRAVALRSGSS